jgi:protein SCO1/2
VATPARIARFSTISSTQPIDKGHTQLRTTGLAAVVVALIAALAFVGWYWTNRSAGRGDTLASYEGTKLGDAAPAFRLVDQNGRPVALEDFRGMVGVLTLLDPDCTDICPIYAHHYQLAYQALGSDAAKVAFLAFNSNDEKTSVADVAAATKKWGVDAVPTWHFLTGSAEELRAVWRAYGLMGSGPPKPNRPEEKQHSPAIYVIDQAGKRRWYFSTNFEGAPPPSALIVKHVKSLLAEQH